MVELVKVDPGSGLLFAVLLCMLEIFHKKRWKAKKKKQWIKLLVFSTRFFLTFLLIVNNLVTQVWADFLPLMSKLVISPSLGHMSSDFMVQKNCLGLRLRGSASGSGSRAQEITLFATIGSSSDQALVGWMVTLTMICFHPNLQNPWIWLYLEKGLLPI